MTGPEITPEIVVRARELYELLVPDPTAYGWPEPQHDDWCCAKGCPGVGYCADAAMGGCEGDCKCSARELIVWFSFGWAYGYQQAAVTLGPREDLRRPLADREAALFAELRKLHGLAGAPSSRAIATALGNAMSHATVNDILKGRRVPRWPTLAKIVEALDGDREAFLQLWAATRLEAWMP